MGNGQIDKYALIINGDTASRHLENVDRSLELLESKGFETFVASPSKPKSSSDHYTSAAIDQISEIVEGLKSQIDDDDELVIYTTGHGNKEEGQASLCVEDGCDYEELAPLLDIQSYGQRTVVMDQCYGGEWGQLFVDDPRTLFISQGNTDETVSCGQFAPYLWAPDSEIPDLNEDGIISWQERYAYATDKLLSSFPQHVATAGYIQGGEAPFESRVTEIETDAQLDEALDRLAPGQYAVITFSADWCAPCHVFAPQFDEFAVETQGQYLFLRTENEALAKKYNAVGFPTVMIIDHQGNSQVVRNYKAVLEEIGKFKLSFDERLDLLAVQLEDPDPIIRGSAYFYLFGLWNNSDEKPLENPAKVCRLLTTTNKKDIPRKPFYFKRIGPIAYAEAFKQLEPDEAAKEITVLSNLLDSSVARHQWFALSSYRALARHLNGKRVFEASKVRECFNDPLIRKEVRNEAYQVYRYYLIPRMTPEEVSEEAKEIKKLLSDPMIWGYHHRPNPFIDRELAKKSTPEVAGEEIFPSAGHLISIYLDLALTTAFPPELAVEEIRIIRELMLDPNYMLSARKVYRNLAQNLPEEVAAEEAEILRPYLIDCETSQDFDSCWAYGKAYLSLIERLSAETAAREAPEIRSIFESSNSGARRWASSHYEALAAKLSPKATKKEAKELREMFEANDPETRRAAIWAYGDLGEYLPPRELKKGVRILQKLEEEDPDILVRAAARLALRNNLMVSE